MARILDRELSIQTVKVMPTYTQPVGFVKTTNPFIKLVDRPQSLPQPTDQPTSSDLPGTKPPAVQRQVTSKSTTDRPQKVDQQRTTDLCGTKSAPQRQATSKSTSELTRGLSASCMDTD